MLPILILLNTEKNIVNIVMQVTGKNRIKWKYSFYKEIYKCTTESGV